MIENWHTSYKTCPSWLRLHQDSVDAGQACSSKDLNIKNPVLPFYVEKFRKAGCVEVVYLLGMTLVHCPCFTCIEQSRKHCCPIYLQLCL